MWIENTVWVKHVALCVFSRRVRLQIRNWPKTVIHTRNETRGETHWIQVFHLAYVHYTPLKGPWDRGVTINTVQTCPVHHILPILLVPAAEWCSPPRPIHAVPDQTCWSRLPPSPWSWQSSGRRRYPGILSWGRRHTCTGVEDKFIQIKHQPSTDSGER